MAATQKVQFILEAVDEASGAVKKIAGGFQELGDSGKATKLEIAAAGTAILGATAAIASKAIDTFAQFEQTMSGVRAVLNPTAEEFDRLSEKARELGRTTAYSAQEAGEAIEMLAKNGLNATQIMDGAVDSTLALAAATGADLSTAADIASSAMLAFGLQVGDLNQVVNSITGTTNLSKFGIEDYALALAQGGGVAKAVGVNFQDFNAAIAAISPLFQSGSDAGTSFKTFLLRLVPASNTAADAMEQLGLITKEGQNQFFDAQGQMKSMADISQVLKEALTGLSDEQRNSTLNTIFGTDAMRAAAGMAGVGKEAFEAMSQAIEGTDAAENAKVRMDNLKGAFEQLSGSVDDILISLGEALMPLIKGVAQGLNWLANKTSELIAWFKTLPGPVQDIVQILGAVVVGTVLLTSALAVLSVTMGGVAAAMGAILVASRPIIAIMAAIALAVYALYKAYQTNFLGIKTAVDAVVDWFKSIPERWDNIVNAVKQGLENLRQWFSTAWDNVKAGAQAFWDFIKAAFQANIDLVVGIIGGFIGIIVGIFRAFYQLLQGDRQGAWETIRTTFVNVWNGIIAFITPIIEFLKGLLSAAWAAISATFQSVWNGIKTYFSGLWTSIKTTVMEAITWLKGFFGKDGKQMVEDGFSAMVGGLVGIIKSVLNGVIGAFEGMINFAIQGINKLIAAANKVSPIGISQLSPVSIPRLAFGGVVPGQGHYDTVPALLSPGEIVLNRAQQGRLASQLEGGGGGTTIIIDMHDNSLYGHPEQLIDQIGDGVIERLKIHTALQSF